MVAPGYTDADMPDYVTCAGPNNSMDVHQRRYLGNNRSTAIGGELYYPDSRPGNFQIFDREPSLLIFREDITKPAIYAITWMNHGKNCAR